MTPWQHIIQANNLCELLMTNTIFFTLKLEKAVEWPFSYSGAKGHTLVHGLAAVNIWQAPHTSNRDIPWLPDVITMSHVVPELAHSSLISTQKLCNAGCKVVLDKEECRVYYQGKQVLIGGRDPVTELQ